MNAKRDRQPWIVVAGILVIGMGLLAGLVLMQRPVFARPIEVVLQIQQVELADSVELSAETLSALLREALERHPRVSTVGPTFRV